MGSAREWRRCSCSSSVDWACVMAGLGGVSLSAGVVEGEVEAEAEAEAEVDLCVGMGGLSRDDEEEEEEKEEDFKGE